MKKKKKGNGRIFDTNGVMIGMFGNGEPDCVALFDPEDPERIVGLKEIDLEGNREFTNNFVKKHIEWCLNFIDKIGGPEDLDKIFEEDMKRHKERRERRKADKKEKRSEKKAEKPIEPIEQVFDEKKKAVEDWKTVEDYTDSLEYKKYLRNSRHFLELDETRRSLENRLDSVKTKLKKLKKKCDVFEDDLFKSNLSKTQKGEVMFAALTDLIKAKKQHKGDE